MKSRSRDKQKFLFITTNEEKILYNNGEIKKVKKEEDVTGAEIRFARKMIRISPKLPPHIFIYKNKDEKLNEKYTVPKIVDRLYMHNFIVYIDHERKRVEVLIDDGEVVELNYEKLDFLRKYFYVVRGGIYLESVTPEEFEILHEYEKSNNLVKRFFSFLH